MSAAPAAGKEQTKRMAVKPLMAWRSPLGRWAVLDPVNRAVIAFDAFEETAVAETPTEAHWMLNESFASNPAVAAPVLKDLVQILFVEVEGGAKVLVGLLGVEPMADQMLDGRWNDDVFRGRVGHAKGSRLQRLGLTAFACILA